MADQERFNFYVVFTMILCGVKFCDQQVVKLIFPVDSEWPHPVSFVDLQLIRTQLPQLLLSNVSYNLSSQRVMVNHIKVRPLQFFQTSLFSAMETFSDFRKSRFKFIVIGFKGGYFG